MKKDFGKKIFALMVESGIKTAKDLADKINEAANQKIVTPSSVGKWLSGQSQPKAISLMFLAKALNISADVILYDEGENPQRTKELTKMVTEIVKIETKKVLNKVKPNLEIALEKFVGSENIPQEDKDSILRQIENLLKLYPDKEK